MKYQTITLVIMGSIFSIISMSAITLLENMN